MTGTLADDLLRRELQDFVKSQIAPYKYPRAIEFVPELPHSSTGKLQRPGCESRNGGNRTRQVCNIASRDFYVRNHGRYFDLHSCVGFNQS